jgi:hypothetical protein
MSVDVFVYDNFMAWVTAGIDIVEQDRGGSVVDSKTSALLTSGEYGAKLSRPSPAKPVQVVLDDPSGAYAPTTFAHLNAKVTIRLDVVLYPLPKAAIVVSGGVGGGGSGGAIKGWTPGPLPGGGPANVISTNIASGRWTDDQAAGVASLADSVVRAKSCPSLDSAMKARLNRWCEWLRNLGIDPDLFDRVPRPGGGDDDQGFGYKQGFPMIKDSAQQKKPIVR